MLMVLPPKARVVVATAAVTGARAGELAGMRWEAWHDGAIHIKKVVWNGIVLDSPKTEASEAPIPVIARLAVMLNQHRMMLGNPQTGWMFPQGNGQPLRPSNLVNRQIKPALERCAVCRRNKAKHKLKIKDDDHEFQRDNSLPRWEGWHALRRGLSTNLYRLGVSDKVIQRIMRHSNVEVTRKDYIKTNTADAKEGLDKIDMASPYAERALEATNAPSGRVN